MSFGYVPTPALVAPIEFTLRASDYAAMGGYVDQVKPVTQIETASARRIGRSAQGHDPLAAQHYHWAKGDKR